MGNYTYKATVDPYIVDDLPDTFLEASEWLKKKLPPTGRGKGIKICLVDSGVVDHTSVKIHAAANLGKSDSNYDFSGHATMIGGIMTGNIKHYKGIASDAALMCAKCCDDKDRSNATSIAASILWGVVVGAHVIVVPYIVKNDDENINAAVNKAYENNVVVVFEGTGEGSIDIPKSISTKNIDIVDQDILAPFVNEEFALVKSFEVTPAIVGGTVAVLVERMWQSPKKLAPDKFLASVRNALQGDLTEDK